MRIDAHYHLDESLESVERLLAQMRMHGIDRVALIASVCEPLHVGRVGAAFVRTMRRALAGGAPRLGQLLYRSTVRGRGRVAFLGRSSAIHAEPDNDAVEAALAAQPDRFVGWLFVNPQTAAKVAEIERRLRNPGWIGVKAHPFWHRYPVEALDEVASLCQERGKPMLVHLGAGARRGDFRHLPERFPRLKLVYAHAGIPWYGALWDYAVKRENVFVDLSSPYLDRSLRHRALRALGPSRCLYGTDGPYGYPAADGGYDHGAILRQIERAALPARELDLVLGGNFKALAAL
ncbi:MAG TPA: amidohydrolase family protein [Myxococcales bacterium]|jgi:predicted TIM-barrel fold metal-dependent hydrolase|nr:amidohydrolase family protein [Myxococcales bacterium]